MQPCEKPEPFRYSTGWIEVIKGKCKKKILRKFCRSNNYFKFQEVVSNEHTS
uniref:Uncharacterized protein n=1 Tax=Arundo donax TaxID=35708 RepID=A0A0A9HPC3_ARUDO